MDSYHNRVVGEINEHLDELAAEEKPWEAKWIAHAVCREHTDGLADSEDAEFWRWSSYRTIRDLTRREINKRTDPPIGEKQDQQIVLDGFEREHLQDYYLVEREDTEVAIPVTQLTDAEIGAKVAEKRAMGAACFAHAHELRRFKRWRRDAETA